MKNDRILIFCGVRSNSTKWSPLESNFFWCGRFGKKGHCCTKGELYTLRKVTYPSNFITAKKVIQNHCNETDNNRLTITMHSVFVLQ